ncbi:unnamed protein product [Phyllotreta striolata]|uniref:Histone deacetylase domain-containing protein n=1 Tax=Phyllotreta striolata TaxID=444603 RepID=A0A9N9XKS8_PHYSR|nr:unnamed protein product [Phyllotreta striolata]
MADREKNTPGASNISNKSTTNISRPKLKDLIAERRKQKLTDSNQSELMDPFEAVNKYKSNVERRTGYVEEESPEHFCKWDPLYPENAERVACPKRRLAALKLRERCVNIVPTELPDRAFLKLHTKNLYEKLKAIRSVTDDQLEHESSKFDSVYFTQHTFSAAKLAAEAAIALTLEVAKGNLKNGFALIRPPGHHAMVDEFCGYCFLNNVALAAQTAIDEGLAKKVLIVDHDVHHGQGIQRMFYDRNDVLYFSIHRYEHGLFWPNLRESESDYVGEGAGKGYNINIPLNETGLTDADYLAIVLNVLLPVAYEFKPDLILISAGYDSALGCPEGEMLVTPHFYSHLITLLSGLANGKIVVCLEGGYFPESVAEGVACTLKALLGDACHPISAKPEINSSLIEVINNTKYFLRDYWECFKQDSLFSYPKNVELQNCLDVDKTSEHLSCLSYKFVPKEMTEFETTGFYPIRTEDEVKMYLKMVNDLRNEYLITGEKPNVVGYVYDDFLLKHKPAGDHGNIPERPERLLEIIKTFDQFDLLKRCKKIQESDRDPAKWIKIVHQENYAGDILAQKNVEQRPDWFFNADTAKCVLKCVSNILSLAESIHEGHVRSGVAVVRPPGHHACFDEASGFCFVNNVVIAAEYLIREKNYKRILIVDFDIHHGNGTQRLTYDKKEIMYISIHRFDKAKYFPFSPEANYTYTGEKEGDGYNINIPFNKGNKTEHDYWTVWLKLVLPLAYSYNPEFVIVSAGFDAAYFDPLGNGYKLTPEIYGHFVQTLKPLACGKLLVALEGGYHLESTALSMTMCAKALLGDDLPVPKLSGKVDPDTRETIQNVLSVHQEKWKVLRVNKKIAGFSCTEEEQQLLEEACREEMCKKGTVENLRRMFKKNIKNVE